MIFSELLAPEISASEKNTLGMSKLRFYFSPFVNRSSPN